jgi:general nucleoside transport system permease protein
MIKLEIEKRNNVGLIRQVLSFMIALFAAMIVTGCLLYWAGLDAIEAFLAVYEGAFVGVEAIVETLVRATPLILTGLATVVAFRASVWNIGQEGQLVLGAILGFWVSIAFSYLPYYLLIPLVIAAGFVGGGALGALCGWLKSRYDVSEIISTVMLNYVVIYLLTYLISGPWMAPGEFYLHTAPLSENSILPTLLEDTRLHVGFIISIVAAIGIHVLINKTSFGYDIKAFGYNSVACKFKGMNVPRTLVLVMMISGGLSGLAGAGELFGVQDRLSGSIAQNLGFTGILVAMCGGLSPLGTLLAAILFGGLVNGGFMMQILTGVPASMVYVMQAVVLLFFLCSGLLATFRIRITIQKRVKQ